MGRRGNAQKAMGGMVNVGTKQTHVDNNTIMHQDSDFQSLTTFAGLNALDPCMTKVRVAGVSAVLEPSTVTSTTTEFAGFLENAALWTPFIDAYHECTRRRGCFCGHVYVE